MYLKILACDLDGTLAHNGIVAPETWKALRKARDKGLTLMLVTGRSLDTFSADGLFAELFEAIVAEDGAAVYFTRNNEVNLPFGRLDQEVIQQLEQRQIPFEKGTAIISSWMPQIDEIEQVLHETGRSATIEYNKGAGMVLPPGATKGTGLRFALRELGYSEHNVIACGDAENDRSLFEVAEYAAAPSNAIPEIKALADYTLPFPDGKGVCYLIEKLFQGKLLPCQEKKDTYLSLGVKENGSMLHVHPGKLVDGNLGIIGASASGKSWLAGLLVEGLLQKGYQVCIIDPEGDYSALRAFPHTLVLGNEGLPPIEEVIALSEYTNTSLILDLSTHEVEGRLAYVTDLARALFGLRARRGRPHWFLFDEIQSFCPPQGGPLTDLILGGMQERGIGVVSYRPSLVAPAILKAIDSWLLTRIEMPEEIAQIKELIPQIPNVTRRTDQLPTLPVGEAFYLDQQCAEKGAAADMIQLHFADRKVPHVRHLHKYLRAPLPNAKRFYFHTDAQHPGPRSAASLWEFREALETVSVESLHYHLQRGDFEKWIEKVFHDDELARSLRKVRRRAIEDIHLRNELYQAVNDRYERLESLI